MDLEQLADWIEARICDPCKHGYTCDQSDCAQAKQIASILKNMAPFKGSDDGGKAVKGWFVSEETIK